MRDHTKRESMQNGYKHNLTTEAGNWSCRHHRAHTYTNVLDLQLFPCMSKRHSELLQLYCNSEASFDRIWNNGMWLWRFGNQSHRLWFDLSVVCLGLQHRIMEKIIATNGHNDFLQDGALHCNVRRDFWDTERGIKRTSKPTESPEESQSWWTAMYLSCFMSIRMHDV